MDKSTQTVLQQLLSGMAELREMIANQPRLHRKDLMVRYGCSEATLHRWMRNERLPAPIRFRGPLWRLGDLEAAEQAGRLPLPVRLKSA